MYLIKTSLACDNSNEPLEKFANQYTAAKREACLIFLI